MYNIIGRVLLNPETPVKPANNTNNVRNEKAKGNNNPYLSKKI